MANVTKLIIQLRRAHTAEWELNKDVVPRVGEPCFDIDLNTLRIGNGVDAYEKLEPIGGKFEIAADGKSMVLEDGIFKLMGFDAAEVGAQPVKTENGLEWIVPSTEAIDKLHDAVVELQENVSVLQGDVENIGEQVNILNGDETVEGSVLKVVKDEINAFANEISDDGKINTIKELVDYVSSHGGETQAILADVDKIKGLVGEMSVKSQIDAAIANSGHLTKAEAAATFQRAKFEIFSKPNGALVTYGDKEIRVMCPVDTQWEKQTVGATGNANMYYMGFKAYAPEGAVSFKEGDRGQIIDEMYTFDDDFAGVDALGRKYSVCWFALASYDEGTDTWTYFGENSSAEKYIGWTYVVEWYDANGGVISFDTVRINLSNEDCHSIIEPYYIGVMKKDIETVIEEKVKEIDSVYEVVEF